MKAFFVLVLFVLGIVIFTSARAAFARGEDLPSYLVVLFVAFVILLSFVVQRPRRGIRKAVRKMLKQGRDGDLSSRLRVTLGKPDIRVVAELTETTTKWPAVEKIGSTQDHLFVYTGPAAALIIPRRAFSEECSPTTSPTTCPRARSISSSTSRPTT
ncbi:MAG: YcxB family protein [Planctomycetota bacterium]